MSQHTDRLLLKAFRPTGYDRLLQASAIVYVYHLFLLTLILNTIHSSQPILDIHLHLDDRIWFTFIIAMECYLLKGYPCILIHNRN